MNILDFQKMKNNQQKISMVTCYDYWSAQIIAKSNIDCILVGDTAAMIMHGHNTTIPATVSMIVQHIQAVSRGAHNKLIIGDMPFLSYRKDLINSMDAIKSLIQAGAQAIKLEGAEGNIELIKHVVTSGVPVMGHLGLTPQFYHSIGGHKVQGKEEAAIKKLKEDALALEAAGCFSLVLECIPSALAQEITEILHIPTIGIGAGPHTSGQVLVLQDLLGMSEDFNPTFLKKFMNGFDLIKNALNAYDQEVKASSYPCSEKHSY